MKLYASPGACSMAPHIILTELGFPHAIEFVNLRAQPHVLKNSGELYSNVNPKDVVPALKLDSGEVLTENGVILQYLADLKPDSGLLPKMGTMERYHAMEWLNYVGSDVHKSFGLLFNPNMPEEGKSALRQVAARKLAYLDQHLAKQPYLTGEKFGIADAYLWVVTGWAPMLKVDMTPYPNLQKFRERISARPAVAQVLKAEGLS